MDLSPATLRARFHELGEERAAKLAVSGPLREARDQLVNDNRAAEAGCDAQIAAAEEGLFDIDQERATIARALGGKTGTADA